MIGEMMSGTLASKLATRENILPISPGGVTLDSNDRMTMAGVVDIMPIKAPKMIRLFGWGFISKTCLANTY
jgi:hypothetical protein